jgi:hypothetical protein
VVVEAELEVTEPEVAELEVTVMEDTDRSLEPAQFVR